MGTVESVRGSIPLNDSDRSRLRVLRRDAFTSEPLANLPKAREGGYQRVMYEGLRASNAHASILLLPPGQASPAHSSYAEHIVTMLAGSVTFRTKDETVRLGYLDQLFIPAEVAYEYWNSGLENASFLNMVLRAGEWPPPASHYVDELG
jgi:quercetin dioxygenase-like cupin family protein